MMSISFSLTLIFHVLASATAYLVDPPTIALPDTIQDCSAWWVAEDHQNCNYISTVTGLGYITFAHYNPECGRHDVITVGNSYCVEQNFGLPPEPTPTPTTFNPSLPANGIATPTPIQKGMTGNCNMFYPVLADDTCYDIAAINAISLNDFYAWNSAVGSQCGALLANTWVCVGVLRGITSMPKPSSTPAPTPTSMKPASTSVGNGVATPKPVQPSMVANCKDFYSVKAGDNCYDIAATSGITLDQFYAWNPYVQSDCSRLWSGYNVCIRIIGFTAPASSTLKTTSSATSSKPASSTPTPVQAGMVSNCKRFYKVQAGDGCWAIADTNKIALESFYSWNPSVKSDCSALWAQYYVCVGL